MSATIQTATGVTIINPQAGPAPARPRDETPTDPDRTPYVGAGATHVVLANGLGPDYARGDKIGQDDLPAGASIDRLMGISPAPLRALTADELKAVPPRKKAAESKPEK